ncbi:Hypothetical predicted protein [Mytilus galloprovincialis]|uniref:Ig-like domain-containing protein n=1 Tax=Mytilus galloprovincialis TaxID=29158 RepID=A0A8B6G2D6_MYTGA|nr:Hypothetical predicted protein [Mytilus galloprovincialis]
MKQLLPLLILLNCHMIQGVLEWIVSAKVTDYGQDVTLFCNVSNCCPNDAGWDRYSPEQRTLFIDVKTGHSNKKYDGKTLRGGYTLVIKNLTKNDLNVSYACVYGVTIGQSKFLWKEDVFTYISDTTPNPPNDNSRLSEIQIAGITIGIVVLVGVAVAIFVLFLKKTRKKGHISEVEAMPLLDYFLEDPSNIECIEGKDATLTCKVRAGSPPVQWKKASTAITSNENCLMSNKDTEYNLILKNVKPSDSGEYCVEVGQFSKTIKLAIKGMDFVKITIKWYNVK